jgi:hypothetical protein
VKAGSLLKRRDVSMMTGLTSSAPGICSAIETTSTEDQSPPKSRILVGDKPHGPVTIPRCSIRLLRVQANLRRIEALHGRIATLEWVRAIGDRENQRGRVAVVVVRLAWGSVPTCYLASAAALRASGQKSSTSVQLGDWGRRFGDKEPVVHRVMHREWGVIRVPTNRVVRQMKERP